MRSRAARILWHDLSSLAKFDELKDLKALQKLGLGGCEHLANIDARKGLKGLRKLDLRGCMQLSPVAVDQLRAALPETEIRF